MKGMFSHISVSIRKIGKGARRSRERLLMWGAAALLACSLAVLAWDAYTFYHSTVGVRMRRAEPDPELSVDAFAESISTVMELFETRSARHEAFMGVQ